MVLSARRTRGSSVRGAVGEIELAEVQRGAASRRRRRSGGSDAAAPPAPAAAGVLPADAPERRLVIRMLHAFDRLFSRAYHRLKVLDACPLPLSGPAILVCNHTGPLDPLFLQAVSSRRLINWMMASEYMKIPVLSWVFRTIGIIPVDRSGRDSGPLRAALRALGQGRILGIFPEGRIEETRELLPFQTGVALMAIKAKVPVYPAYLDGTQRGQGMLAACLSPNDGILAFGPVVDLGRFGTGKAELDEATEIIRQAVDALRRRVEASRFGEHGGGGELRDFGQIPARL